MSRKLENKIAVVLGASAGIGFATAKHFVDEGAHVFIVGRRKAELDQAKAALGPNVTAVQADVSDLGDIDRLYAQVRADKGRIDALVLNAGFVEMVTLADATPEHFDKTFGLNARGTFFAMQRALPLLSDGASVVIVSSGAHLKGIPFYTTYSATKAAQRSFARSWAAELAPRGVRVNTLSPGAIDTAIIDGQVGFDKTKADALKASFASGTPLQRIGQPEEMAKAILFLASSDASYVTGADLVADGGLTQI